MSNPKTALFIYHITSNMFLLMWSSSRCLQEQKGKHSQLYRNRCGCFPFYSCKQRDDGRNMLLIVWYMSKIVVFGLDSYFWKYQNCFSTGCHESQAGLWTVLSLIDGRTFVEIDERSRRPSLIRNDEVIAKVSYLFSAYWRQPIREVAEKLRASIGSSQAVLTKDLYMWQVSANFLLRMLTSAQKEHACL